MTDKLQFDDEPAMRQAIAEVRSDASDVNWVLFGYKEGTKNVLTLVGQGSGGVSEFVDSLSEEHAMYGLVRLVEQIDESKTIKFVYVNWIGDKMKVMQKAGLGVLKGQVTKFMDPHHLEHTCGSKDEISEEILNSRIAEASGVKSHVVGRNHAEETPMFIAQQPVGKASGSSNRNKSFAPISAGRQLKYPDEAALKAAMDDVRSDATETNWVLYGYEPNTKDTIVLVGSGTGGTAELVTHLKDDTVNYGIVRCVDQIDDSKTVKFASIYWLGDNVPRMHRARVGTHKGEIATLLGQSHVQIDATSKSDVTPEKVEDKIRITSGSKSRVKY